MDEPDPPEPRDPSEPPAFEDDLPSELDEPLPAPTEILGDAEHPFRATLQGATRALGLPEPAVLVDDLLATPADERFARSARRYAERFGDASLVEDPAALSAAVEGLPVSDPVEQGVRTVVRVTGQMEGELVATGVEAAERAGPESGHTPPAGPEAYLALAVAARRLRAVALDVGEVYESDGATDGDLQHLLSAGLALTARLLDLAPTSAAVEDGSAPDDAAASEGEDSEDSEDAEDAAGEAEADDEGIPPVDPGEWLPVLARDVVRAGYHRETARGTPPSTVPAAKTDAELRRIVRLRGALAAVDAFDVSTESAAALVDESPAAVEALLAGRE